jgi:hypothetical protein
MRISIYLLLMLCSVIPAFSATGLKGVLTDARNGQPVADANIMLRNQAIFVTSGSDGTFFITNAETGKDVLEIIAYGYADNYLDVNIVDGIVSDLGTIKMNASEFDSSALNTDDYIFDESQILEDEGNSQSIGTIQGATDDVYYQAANYNFSSTMRFRLRGYDSNWSAGYINGFEYNDAMRGRFNFSGLGGMTSSAFRSKSVDVGLAAASYGFGNVGGASNFTTYASQYAPGFRGNLSYTNSNYMMRAMLQYSTGVTRNGWAFSASIIGRYAPEGVIEGTWYNSFGYSLSLQKIFNDKHSLNLTTWGAPTQRATNQAATQEAYNLAGSNLYNPSWGYLNGKKKSARIVESFDPSALLNWIWKPRMGTTVNTGIGFRHNAYSSSALNWYQAADPRPDYYRYLPSYYIPSATEGTDLYNYQLGVYNTYIDLWENDATARQIDWNSIYRTNNLNRTNYDRNSEYVGQSTYILENRHSNIDSWMFNSYIDHRLTDNMTLQGGVSFNYSNAHYYKTVRDLLGGEFWRDIDNYAERDFPDDPTMLQNDLDNPNRLVKEGDVFGYNYNIHNVKAKAWLQNQINTTHWNVNYGLDMSYTSFQRFGKMRNGRAPENSYGKGELHEFDNASIKAGATYKLNGRNYFVIHGSYGTRAPMPDYAYVSPRIKDTAVDGLKSEKFLSGDISYVWNYSRFRGSLTGFWTDMFDGIKRTGFYDYDLNTFMNYTMSGIKTEYKGVELGMAYKILPSLTVSAAATYARYQYKNNPMGIRSYENGSEADIERRVYLKNYHIGGTPQQAYNIAIDYNVNNWFFNINGNWFGDTYIDLAPTRHEEMPDLYGVCNTQAEMEEKLAEITYQDKLNNAFILNLSVGKMIYTKFGALNFNVSVNNVLNNRNIQTGGYQESKFDYDNYNVNKFPNKIYCAQGIRVFVNVGIRF